MWKHRDTSVRQEARQATGGGGDGEIYLTFVFCHKRVKHTERENSRGYISPLRQTKGHFSWLAVPAPLQATFYPWHQEHRDLKESTSLGKIKEANKRNGGAWSKS